MSDKVILSETDKYVQHVDVAESYGSRVALLSALIRIASLYQAVFSNRNDFSDDPEFGRIYTEADGELHCKEESGVTRARIFIYVDGKIRLETCKEDKWVSDNDIIFKDLSEALANQTFLKIVKHQAWTLHYDPSDYDLLPNSFTALRMLSRELKLIRATLAGTLSLDVEDLQEFLNKE